MQTPVVYLAFSNNRDDYLPLVNRERKSLTRILHDKDEAGVVKVITEASATLEDIFEYFNRYRNRVVIFHYGGHASGRTLELETPDGSGRSAGAAGLAALLGKEEELRLVFLNGCATQGQVATLLENGVKSVIATSVPVQDKMAVEFSEQFYNALSGNASVGSAFDIASSFIAAKYRNAEPLKIYRGINFGHVGNNGKLCWGLYTQEGNEEILGWSFPHRPVQPLVIKNRFSYVEKPDVNDLLIEIVCDAVADNNPDLDYELRKEPINIPAIKREIVDSFPTPIGEQLRKLFIRADDSRQPDAMQGFTLARLRQITQTYQTTMQFLCFTMLSQLWDIKHSQPGMALEDGFIVDLNSFFAKRDGQAYVFDYSRLVRAISGFFDQQNIPYFIDEFKLLSQDGPHQADLNKAIYFLKETHGAILSGKLDDNQDVETRCKQGEEQLGILLRELAFLVKYKLATIKNIELIKRRHEKPRYRHNQILLNRALTVASTGGPSEVGQIFENFTDSKCVLFLKTKGEQVLDYLNLSPFIIDENALKNDYNTKLYLYAYSEKDNYFFQFLNNAKEAPITVNRQQHPEIKDQLDRFKAQFLGLEYQATAVPANETRRRFPRKRY